MTGPAPIMFQSPSPGEQLQKALAPLLEMLQAQQQRQLQQQQMYMQYGQLTLAKEKFAEEQKQRNEQKKSLEQAGQALVQQIQGLSAPQGMEQQIQSTYQTGDPALIEQMNTAVTALKRGQAIAGVRQKYATLAQQKQQQGQQLDVMDMYNESRELAQADPTNQVLQQAAEDFGLKLAAGEDYVPVYGQNGEIAAFNKRTGKVTQTGVNLGSKGNAGLGQVMARVAPRLGPMMSGMQVMEDIETKAKTDPKYAEAVNQVASAVASERLRFGKVDVGSLIGWYKGLGFNDVAKRYAMAFAATADNLIGMQYNVRSNVQVDLWKQVLIPLYNEIGQSEALSARQKMRRDMAMGYVDVLQGKVNVEDVLSRYPQFKRELFTDRGGLLDVVPGQNKLISPDNPFGARP